MARRSKPALVLRLALLLTLVGIVVYVLWARASVRAGVDELIFSERIRGGFLCIGTSADKPGLMLLSRQPRGPVNLRAATHPILGWTQVTLELEGRSLEWQLERPCVILVSAEGDRQVIPVDWHASIFAGALDRTDCGQEHKSSTEHPRCGRPFLDLMDYLLANCPNRIPAELEAFVAGQADPWASAP
jgi:hypothetical protein